MIVNQKYAHAARPSNTKKSQFPGDRSAISGLRYYSPTLGRFINKDPAGEEGGLNLYAFGGNNSINGYDYLGNSWFSKYIIRPIQKLLGKVNTAVAKSGVNVDGVGVQTSIPITPANPNGQTPRTGPDPFGGTTTGTGNTPGVIVVGTGSAPQSPGGTTNTQPSGGDPNVFTVPNVTTQPIPTPGTTFDPQAPLTVGGYRDYIAETLSDMDDKTGGQYHFNSTEAVNLLLGTALHESGGLRLRGTASSPAIGLFQIQSNTYNDLKSWIDGRRPDIGVALDKLFTPAGETRSYGQLLNDDVYSIAIARLIYWHYGVGEIPTSLAGQAAYYKQYFNTPLGKATPQQYINDWNTYTQGAYDAPPPPPARSSGGRGSPNIQEQ